MPCAPRHGDRAHGCSSREGCPQHATHTTIAWQNALLCDHAEKKTQWRLLEGRRVSRRWLRAEGLLKSGGVGTKQGLVCTLTVHSSRLAEISSRNDVPAHNMPWVPEEAPIPASDLNHNGVRLGGASPNTRTYTRSPVSVNTTRRQ